MVGITPAEQNKLLEHRLVLIRDLMVNDIFLNCFEKIGLKGDWREEFTGLTDQAKASKVLSSVERSSKSAAFKVFIEALVKTDQQPLARKVDNKMALKCIETLKDAKAQEGVSNDSVDTMDSVGSILSEEDKQIMKEIEGLNLTNISVVKPAHLDPRKEQEGVYTISGDKSKRYAIIINNLYFTSTRLATRDGTEKDAENLKRLLNELDFQYRYTKETHENLTDEKIKQTLTEECQIANDQSVDIIMVFILSHGCAGAVYGQNSKPVYFQPTILDIFHSKNYKNLIGKPKLFFIQACQVKTADQVEKVTETDISGYPDTMLAFSTCTDYVSWKSPELGSWFIRTVICVLTKYAYTQDVRRLMTVVCRIVSQMKETDHTQLPYNRDTLKKTCFLFPEY